MQNATQEVLSRLAARGYRITQARKEIVALLAEKSVPLTVQELAERSRSDEASVYRTTALLLEEGLLETIHTIGEQPRYALALDHHHHIVCSNCGYTLHLDCDDLPVPRTPKQFSKITHHEVTFYGTCTACA